MITTKLTGAAAMASVLALMVGALPGAALAQDARDDSVLTRQRPEFDPLGIRAGSLMLFPQVQVAAQFDDNIFATDDDEEDDFIIAVRPSIEARSDWSRHALSLTADAESAFFIDNDDSNYNDVGLAADGRIDVIGQSSIRLRGFIRKDHEDRDSADEAGDEDVTDLIDGGASIAYRHFFNRIFIQPGVAVRRRDYDDVGPVNNDDRDIWRFSPSLRVGYAVSPDLAIFANAEVNQVTYDETPNDAGVDRDSEGGSLTVGAEVDLTGKLIGEIQAGYQVQEFDDNDLEDFSGLRAEGQITYNATPLTAIIGSLGAGLQETTVTLDGDVASANFVSEIGLQVVHELRRNIILRGSGAYTREDFEGISRTDDRFALGAGVSYSLNRNLAIDLGYTFSNRSSDVDEAEFSRNIFTIGVTARL